MALRVEFEDGESSEVLIYLGETIETPCEPVGGYQPITVKSLGTLTPFQVTTKPDITEEKGINCNIEGRFQTITVMDIYSKNSIDELRFQDYEYKNVNQGDEKATLKPFLAGDASVACKPASSTCQSGPSTCRPLPWASPVHMGSNATSSSDDKSVPEFNEDQVDMLEIQSNLEKITLKTKLECSYARNPYSSQHLKPSTSADVLISVRQRPFSLGFDGDFASVRELPHGRGTLKTTSDECLYTGDWCKGQRYGKGEGLIFSLSDGTHSTAQHGFYIGGWKHNMRHGCGKMLFSSDAVYEGQWQFDKMTGYGTLNLPDGTIQEGTWRDGSLQGCAAFIWPHGVAEYREYDACQGLLSSCKIEKETAETRLRMSAIQLQLLKARDCVTELRHENRCVKEQLNALNEENAAMFTELNTLTLEICKSYEEQWERETQKQRVDLENALKAAEESQSNAAKLRKELEETQRALMCKICFTRPRDCIILPCSHLLFCRVCVTEHKNSGSLRCPACRGTINSEILCNVNHSSENVS